MSLERYNMATRWIVTFIRVAAFASLIVTVLASIAPAPQRPTIGAPGIFEHMTAYAICGFLFMTGFSTTRITVIGLGLAALASVLEMAQFYIPERQARISDVLFSAAGGIAGILIARTLIRTFTEERRLDK